MDADLAQNQSAFMIDLQQISVALNLATNRSLLIIDEFGKGTDSHGELLEDTSRDSQLTYSQMVQDWLLASSTICSRGENNVQRFSVLHTSMVCSETKPCGIIDLTVV